MADFTDDQALFLLGFITLYILVFVIIEKVNIYKHEVSKKKAWRNKIKERQQELLDIAKEIENSADEILLTDQSLTASLALLDAVLVSHKRLIEHC